MAIPGNRVSRDIDQSLERARAEVDRIGRELDAASATHESLRREEAQKIAELARFRLGALDAERVAGGLDAADQRALELLQHKRAALDGLRSAITDSERAQQALARRRGEILEECDAARRALDEQVRSTQARLEATEEWQFQRARTERAAETAAHADSKADRAEEDRRTKGAPYERDKLFAYLWKRRYRFPEYRANRVVRAVDDWVARLCGYERAHRDYGLLLEIPRRLRAHADARAAEANAEAKALASTEQEAMAADGVPALRDALAERERALADVDARIDAEEAREAAAVTERAAIEAGTDETTSEALKVLADQLAREDVSTLRTDAARTRGAEDDAIVEAIAGLRARQPDASSHMATLRGEQQRALSTLRDLEELRRRFRRERYDSSDSMFDDGFDVGGLLGGLLHGGLVLGEAWTRMNRHHRFRHRSSSSTAATVGNVLGHVLSSAMRSGGGGFKIGGGGFGGGGFRSGGGFGGGGFKTGGGF